MQLKRFIYKYLFSLIKLLKQLHISLLEMQENSCNPTSQKIVKAFFTSSNWAMHVIEGLQT